MTDRTTGPADSRNSRQVPRMTPYELVFMEGEFESRVFPEIRAEAVEQEIGPLTPERFAFLTTAGDVVRAVTPEDAPPDSLDQYRALLFQAYHFWEAQKALYVIEPATARFLVEAAPSLEGWSFTPPATAGYVQLPANLFWGSISSGATPEPVDGFFFTTTEGEDRHGLSFAHLQILMVLGIRRSRAGFSVIPLETQLDPTIVELLRAPSRSEGDFANALPGGEIDSLYSIVTSAEALKLLLRAFAYVERFPDALLTVQASEPRDEASEPPPTNLARIRVQLADPAGPASTTT